MAKVYVRKVLDDIWKDKDFPQDYTMEYIGEKELNHKLDDFKNHLENADRMILSAKFGDGKSFFLQKIREDRERFSEYEFITIYPVNYVVVQNEDIFEYIKRDILIQLVKLESSIWPYHQEIVG